MFEVCGLKSLPKNAKFCKDNSGWQKMNGPVHSAWTDCHRKAHPSYFSTTLTIACVLRINRQSYRIITVGPVLTDQLYERSPVMKRHDLGVCNHLNDGISWQVTLSALPGFSWESTYLLKTALSCKQRRLFKTDSNKLVHVPRGEQITGAEIL